MSKLEKLLIACKNGNIEKVKKLIKPSFLGKGADVNGIGEGGYSPLLWAVKNDNQELKDLLVSNGANINAYDSKLGLAPLHFAVEEGKTELIDLLLSNDADINLGIKNKKNTPLFYALFKEHMEIARLLVSKGADVNARRGGGESLLSLYIALNRKETIEFLISKGADVNIKSDQGNTPIIVALKSISNMLERSGPGFWGSIAGKVCKGHIETIKLLISKGADPSIKNNNGESPHLLIQKLQSSFPEISELNSVIDQKETD